QELGSVAAQVGMRTVGEFALSKQKDANDRMNQAQAAYEQAKAQGDAAGMASASDSWNQAKSDYQRWNDGSASMNILHGVVGAAASALGGGNAAQGAAGAIAGEAATPYLASNLGRDGAALGAALIGGAVGGGSGAAAANNGVLYNYLSHDQKALEQKEIKDCGVNYLCLVQVNAKWSAISTEQNVGLGVGVVAGIGHSSRNALDAIAYMEPGQIMDGIKAMITDPNVAAQIPVDVLKSFKERYDFIEQQMGVAGWDGSVKAGEAIGSLLFDAGTAVAGVRGGLKLANELPDAARKVADAVTDLGALIKNGGQSAAGSDVPIATAVADAEAGTSAANMQSQISSAVDVAPVVSGGEADTEQYAKLKAFYAEQDAGYISQTSQVQGVKTFQTLGVDSATAQNYLATQPGQNMLSALWAADPSASSAQIYARAMDQLSSGATLPQMGVVSTPLVKVVPQGVGVSPYSPFFTTMEELGRASQSGRTVADYFGLPLNSESTTYSIYQISPAQPAGVFINQVAPATEFGGLIQRAGGGVQYIVPNRGLWSDPVLIGSMHN
uniref:hypothetical protein n=1 Tax=Frateuria defendens TaxID=2219559 RepID=UPI000AFAFE0F